MVCPPDMALTLDFRPLPELYGLGDLHFDDLAR